MMNEKKKKIVTITVMGIIFLLVILITATYAYFSATSNAEKQQITTAKEELIVTPTSDPIHIANIKPINNFELNGTCGTYFPPDACPTHENGKNRVNEDVVTIPISVESKSTIDINYNLTIKPENLNINTGNDEDNKELIGGTTEDIKWVLFKLDGKNGDSEEPESYGDFYNTEKEQNMLTEITIEPDTTHYYMLFIYIEDEDVTQNKLQNITFDVIIGANTKPIEIVGRKLYEVILENNIIKDREPNFNPVKYVNVQGSYRTGLSDKGLFKIQDQNIYYFRGASMHRGNSGENNKTVYFGRFKENDNLFQNVRQDWPITWSILRINADNSVTLILDSVLASIAMGNDLYTFSNPSEKSDYEGSNIKEDLEKWFENTFTDEEKNMIQKTTFCNDRSNNYQGVSDRLNNAIPTPTLDCPEKDKIDANIGLPTADEMFFAGMYRTYNDSYCGPYGCSFEFVNTLTMSPASENSLYNCTDYYCKASTSNSGHIYPVITLKPDVTISESMYNDNTFKSELGTRLLVGYDE